MKKMIYICLIIFICISAISTIDFANTSNTKSTTIEDGEYVLESSLDRNKVVKVNYKEQMLQCMKTKDLQHKDIK